MKKRFFISFFLLGLSSIFSQTLFLREAILSFYGNEFFIGICLSFWLIWVAFGSLFFSKFLKSEKFFPLIHILIPLLLFFEIFLLRSINIFGLAGEIPDFLKAILSVFLISFPLCVFLGIWWSLGTKIFSQILKIEALNKAYLFETIGFFVGGILFSFLLVNLNEFFVAFLLFSLNTLVAFYLSQKKIFLVLFALSFLVLPFLSKLDFFTLNLRFQNQDLVEFKNSPYGKIVVTKIGDQFNFYQNGVFLGSNYDFLFAEEFCHLTLLQKEKLEKVLLIGGGYKGIVNEILKQPVKEVYYVELDPSLIRVILPYLRNEVKEAFFDERVKIIFEDGFYFLKRNNQKFDVILLDLPAPSSALINRFYTQEFFKLAKENLKEDGILAFHLPFSPSFLNKNLENLNKIVFQTLKENFKEVFVLPEENIIFLASKDKLIKDPEILVLRKRERNIETRFLTEDYIKYRYLIDRIEMALSLFEKESEKNSILKPVAYFYQILFWLDKFHPTFTKIFEKLSLNFEKIFFLFLFIFSLIFFKFWRKKPQISPLFSMAIAGFSIMALENLILISFQSLIGYLYFKLSLLIALFMLGMAFGVYFWSKKKACFPSLINLHLILIFFCLLFALSFPLLFKFKNKFLIETLIFLFTFFAGFFGGGFFPIANQIYLSFQKSISKKTGTIYALDLLGSFFGSFSISLIFLPLFGFSYSLFLVSFLNFLSLLFLYLTSR